MWLFLIIVLVLLVLFSLWQHKLPHKAVIEMTKGIVQEDPQTLADAAGVNLEVYSLARVGQSEEGLSSDRAKIAVMYACKRHADKQGKSITEVVTAGNPKRSDYEEANGHYGRQGIHPYCTTIATPTSNTIALAQSVYDEVAIDETEGAQFWDNPHTQDVLHAVQPYDEATGKGYRSSEEIAQRRQSKGLKLITIDGISTRFWA